MFYSHRRALAVIAASAALALGAAGCAQTKDNGSGTTSSGAITTGTTDKVTSLDPAGSYDNGSFFVMNQIYGFLMNTAPGATDVTPQPDLAESASYTTPTTYTVKLKPGLKFVNGHDLTSSDVKFTFDRMVKINDPNGPASLLGNLVKTEATDATTVVFTLKQANDQIFPQILASPAGPIVDEEVFPADKVLADADIVEGHPFSGQYDISSYSLNQLISFKAWDGYQGSLGNAANSTVNTKYYADASNMKLDLEQGNIDVAYRSLSATDIASLRSNDKVAVHEGPGGEIRYIVFNFNTMPFGATTSDASTAKAQAVRQAMADLVDRSAIATNVYKDTYTPLYGYVPSGLKGAGEQFKTLYGDGNGKPDLDKAKKALSDAGVATPVTINLQYNPDHYGPSSGDEYALIKTQLENGGLFKVNLQSTEWVQYSKDRTNDVYPVYQLGWFPDYSDPENYLSPFFVKDNFLNNHYDNATVQSLIAKQVSITDTAEREKAILEIQDLVSKDISTLPLLQGKQFAISGTSVQGVTLDASFKFRLAPLSK
ncbi:ABC transporter substrate-binding protein [Propionicicella superfundia]|uniref:ABC transporter substrate-binding protein n=1 Tax=Propionicicella superfundia TaxID=348582 RepID=UPI00041E678A|nr:ABC transporter substrate-binding protein [Propionicicella superfundia]